MRLLTPLTYILSLGLSVTAGHVAAWAGPVSVNAAPRTMKPALPLHALGVPIVRQQTDYSCGPAALAAVLKYFGVFHGSERELYQIVEVSPDQGTLPEHLAAGARHFGLLAHLEQHLNIDRLRMLLASGKLVILEMQAWRSEDRASLPWRDVWDDGHFVVLIGLDDSFAYFMDPSTGQGYTYLPFGELMERWHDYNPHRKNGRESRDIQLGVVISGVLRRPPPRPVLHRLLRLD